MTVRGVSFVVPVYNKQPYLRDVLAQIKGQRGDFERQYVFVDDGSTDGSLERLRELTAGWDNLVIHEQTNSGSAVATNKGIELATMPYVKFVDADDLIHTDATETLLSILEGTDACLAYGNVQRYRDRDALNLDAPISNPAWERMERPLRKAMFNSLFNPTQFLARTDALKDVGGCDERIVFSQEYALTMRLARRWDFIRVDAPIAFLPEEVEGRLSNNEGRQLQRVTRSVANFLRDYPDVPWTLKQAICRRVAGRAWKFQHRSCKAFWLTSRSFWRQYRCWLPVLSNHADFVDHCAQDFEAADPRAMTPIAKETI